MTLQTLKLGVSFEQLIKLMNANFNSIAADLDDMSAISDLIEAHDTSDEAHSALFAQTIQDVAFDEQTGVFTFTLGNGMPITINTALEKVVTNFTYEEEAQQLCLELLDGTHQHIPMGAFINIYAGNATSTIEVTVGADNKISAAIVNGSITMDMLAAAVKDIINSKVDKVAGKGLSTNDYTTTEKDKLAGIQDNANNYVLPVAAATTLGGVLDGGNVSIAADGTMNVGNRIDFSATDSRWSVSDDLFVLTVPSTAIPVGVYRLVTGSTYTAVVVSLSKNATQIFFSASEKFAGYIQII